MTDWRTKEAQQLRASIENDTNRAADGSLTWKSNGNPVPPHCFADAGMEMPAAQERARAEYVARVAAEYRARRAAHGYSDEELAEARNALGEGPIVDVLTGRRIA